jgi:hypothetical protein
MHALLVQANYFYWAVIASKPVRTLTSQTTKRCNVKDVIRNVDSVVAHKHQIKFASSANLHFCSIAANAIALVLPDLSQIKRRRSVSNVRCVQVAIT